MKSVSLKEAWSGEADCRNCTLRQSALFAGLKESDLDHIHDSIDRFNFPPGSLLYRTGDRGDSMFTLRSGLVKLVQYLPDGNHRIVRLAHAADVLGLECLVESPINTTMRRCFSTPTYAAIRQLWCVSSVPRTRLCMRN